MEKNYIDIAWRLSQPDKEIGLTIYLPDETTVFLTCIPFDQFCEAISNLREARCVYGRSFAIEYNREHLQFFSKGSGLSVVATELFVKKFIQEAEAFIDRVKELLHEEA